MNQSNKKRHLIHRFAIWATLFFCLSEASIARAGVGRDMESLFNTLGGGANVTEASAYNSQSGGYYTGGGIYARVPSSTIQFANFQPPSYKAGCGGIDIFLGSMSYINADSLIKAMRQVMSNTVGYSFNLALQTYVPQVYNTMQKLNDIAREINNLNMNSCETAAQITGGMWSQSDIASKQLCQSMGTSNGTFGDWARARQDCGVGGKRDETNKEKKDSHKHQLGDEFNIAWEAIKDQNIFSSDKPLAEFFMSVSGTIVGKKKKSSGDEVVVTTHYSSLINNEALLDTFLFGESKTPVVATVYSCIDNHDKCLEVKEVALAKLSEAQALVPQIEEMLRSMANKMKNHSGELTSKEKSLVELTQIPILKIIAVQNAFMVGNSVINIHEYAEPIAYDYLLGYLEKILDFVSINLKQLEKVQMDDTHIKDFKRDIADIRKMITDKRFGSYQRMLTAISVIEKTNMIEKKMQSMFINYNELK